MGPALRISALLASLALLAVGCGGGGDGVTGTDDGPGATVPAQADTSPAPETVASSHCPSGLPACRTAEGRIVYVEPVDSDGDGDAHFVIAELPGVSLPGVTAIDVRRGLRPDPLPGIGELISAAGPVQTGSYGQDQIHALELHVAGE